jgi:O-antigen/teichoic acid export membrane protein
MVLVYGAFSGLIVFGHSSWSSRVVSEIFVAAVGLLLAAFFLTRDYGLRTRTSASALKKMLSFSLPVLPGSFLSYYFITSDRIFISEMFSAAELGLYSLAFQVSAVLEIGFRAIAPVWESWLFRGKGVRSFNVIVIAIASFLVLSLVGLIAPFFIGIIADFLIDKKFNSVDQFLAPCVFAILSAGFYRLTVSLSMYTKKTKNITYTNFLMLISNIPIMLLFIQYFGVAGAGYAVALTFMIGSGFQLFLFSRNALRMNL